MNNDDYDPVCMSALQVRSHRGPEGSALWVDAACMQIPEEARLLHPDFIAALSKDSEIMDVPVNRIAAVKTDLMTKGYHIVRHRQTLRRKRAL